MKRTTDQASQAPAPTQAQVPANAAPLPTHGGVYEFDPSTKVMRTLEGGAADQAGGQGNGATTGEQA